MLHAVQVGRSIHDIRSAVDVGDRRSAFIEQRCRHASSPDDPQTYCVCQCCDVGPLDLLCMGKLLGRRRIGVSWGGCVSHWDLQGLSDIG